MEEASYWALGAQFSFVSLSIGEGEDDGDPWARKARDRKARALRKGGLAVKARAA